MKSPLNLRLIFLLVPMLYWGCEDDLCLRIDCAGDNAIVFSILDKDTGLEMVYEEKIIDSEKDIEIYYIISDEKVNVFKTSHFRNIRFRPHYKTGANRYFIEVLDQIDTLDLYFTLRHPVNYHGCCDFPRYIIDSIYVNQIPFFPEFPPYGDPKLVIYR